VVIRSRPATASAGVGTRPRATAPPTAYARLVLDIVDRVPAGYVVTYGDVAEMLGSGAARVVGNVMHHHGHEVAWWRVVLSTGHPSPSDPAEALRRLTADGTPLLAGAERVDLAEARWDGVRRQARRRR
jgi:methylated-DNA-protein-cysteine methyltransferase-like protein